MLASPAFAEAPQSLDVPAGSLSDTLGILGTQAGISLGVSGDIGRHHRSNAVRGHMPPSIALRRMLKGTGLDFVAIDARSFRIFERPAKVTKAIAPEAPTPVRDIVVTASKRQTAVQDFPGTLTVLGSGDLDTDRLGRSGTQAIINAIPSIASTHLGPGRNKLIIRGVADSSFTGPTQAIVGQYLGDIRLNYNAPDPDLNLYDMQQIEVLEGPQGTLYGAGSLGGIVRLVPNAPTPDRWGGSAATGIGIRRSGAISNDLAGMINAPLIDDVLAIRAVAYRSVDGGYIDDVGRGLKDVNRSVTEGGRFALRLTPGDGWTIDLGVTSQDIDNRDSQYAERGLLQYRRASAIAQPFDNDYRLGALTISKDWGRTRLVSATGFIRHEVGEVYDATGAALVPIAFNQQNRITLITNETRLSRRGTDGHGWLIGTSIIVNRERLTRDFISAGSATTITGVRNAVTQMAAYGEFSFRPLPRVVTTIGGRLAFSRLSGELLDVLQIEGEPKRSEVEILPSFALSWRPRDRLTLYARYQEGFRPGGLSVSPGAAQVASQRFTGDSISTYEVGARFGDARKDRFHAALSASFAHWEHIQADLVDAAGLPYTANLGNGRILGLELSAAMRVDHVWRIDAGLFLNDSELRRPEAGFADARGAELPNVAAIGGRIGINFNYRLAGDWRIEGGGSLRYFGHSRLGVGRQLDIVQGKYAETAFNARLGTGRYGFSIGVTNLLDQAGNRFALGNPFGVMARRQVTPLAPRTVRFGVDARF
ncbi:TonB-dependent receptor domain-containing protein [Sphingomonas montanisoli]|uniref:TonB-dependent receptor n=1 Tax=Sphingomonas montanisoli TaxID=2606412 RepID=A0A5D9CAL0_9SPHN|nr:TonB-dependent receptor [Sphingomonas montanisoli]TZG27131.1 TonB-dependent receptor [Sphingomonas montanisoli]